MTFTVVGGVSLASVYDCPGGKRTQLRGVRHVLLLYFGLYAPHGMVKVNQCSVEKCW